MFIEKFKAKRIVSHPKVDKIRHKITKYYFDPKILQSLTIKYNIDDSHSEGGQGGVSGQLTPESTPERNNQGGQQKQQHLDTNNPNTDHVDRLNHSRNAKRVKCLDCGKEFDKDMRDSNGSLELRRHTEHKTEWI